MATNVMLNQMSYSPETQAKLDALSVKNNTLGPSFPMPSLKHNGKTGEWMIREIVDGKLSDTPTVFERSGMVEAQVTDDNGKTRKGMVGGSWEGVVLRVAFKATTKWKPDATFQKMTREFTNFKEEPIELLKQVFGPAGQTTTIKTVANYQEFKKYGMLKDSDGNDIKSEFDLKVVLYVYDMKRKEVLKIVAGGNARSEWFEYRNSKKSPAADGFFSIPQAVSHPGTQLFQVKTKFNSTQQKSKQGLPYSNLAFSTSSVLTENELIEVFPVIDRLDAWVKGWADVHAKSKEKLMDQAPVNTAPMPKSAAATISEHAKGDDIDLSDCPF